MKGREEGGKEKRKGETEEGKEKGRRKKKEKITKVSRETKKKSHLPRTLLSSSLRAKIGDSEKITYNLESLTKVPVTEKME